MSDFNDANRDPLTQEHGAHPVGTGLGAAMGGVSAGAAAGAVGGPVGAVVGGVAGAVVGGLAGKAAAEAVKHVKEKYGAAAKIDKSQSFMVGDSAYKKASAHEPGDTKPDGTPGTHFSNSDRLFAENYGVKFIEPTDFFGWRKYGIDVFTDHKMVEEFLRTHKKP